MDGVSADDSYGGLPIVRLGRHAESDEHEVSGNDRSRAIPRLQGAVKRHKTRFVTVPAYSAT